MARIFDSYWMHDVFRSGCWHSNIASAPPTIDSLQLLGPSHHIFTFGNGPGMWPYSYVVFLNLPTFPIPAIFLLGLHQTTFPATDSWDKYYCFCYCYAVMSREGESFFLFPCAVLFDLPGWRRNSTDHYNYYSFWSLWLQKEKKVAMINGE